MRLLRSTLLQTRVIKPPNERQFWYWLNHAWNTYDFINILIKVVYKYKLIYYIDSMINASKK